MIKDMAIIIELDNWVVAYYKGKKFAEGHSLSKEKWIRFGMLLQQDNYDISDMIDVFIEGNEISDESILWDFPEKSEDLHIEIKSIINKAV